MPLAPLAITVTVSLVDMQPSESRRSKLTRVDARRAASSTSAGTTASVVITTSIVASAGASMPAPFAIPPMDQPAPSTTTCLETESVVMIASAAAVPPSADSSRVRALDAGKQVVATVGEADQAGRADDHVDGADADEVGDLLGDGMGRLEAVGAGVAVGATGVEDDGLDDAVLDDLLAPQDRVGLAAVGGEDAGGVEGRALVDDEGEILGPVDFRPAATPAAVKPAGWVTVISWSSSFLGNEAPWWAWRGRRRSRCDLVVAMPRSPSRRPRAGP